MNHTTINSYEPEARQPEESQGKLRFGVISDIQYGRYGDAMGPKLRTALEQLKARAGENELDAIIFGGDMTNNGYADEYNAVISIIQEVFPPETSHTKMLFVRGNHDNYGNRQANYGVVTSAYPYNSSTTTVHDIKGYQFIVVGQDTSGNYARHCRRITYAGYNQLAERFSHCGRTKRYDRGKADFCCDASAYQGHGLRLQDH